jgi:hypothetical protein
MSWGWREDPWKPSGALLGVGLEASELAEHPASASSSIDNAATKSRFMILPRSSSNRASICGELIRHR